VCLPLRKIIDDSDSNCYKKRMSPKQIAIRKALGMTQSQLADRIAAHRVSVARWETGRNEPKGAYLKALNELAAKIKTKR
jgi:DNA-binding transcriptional regulator YiaG